MRPEDYGFISECFTGVVIKAEATLSGATLECMFLVILTRVRAKLAG